MKTKFAERLKELRLEKGISLVALSKEVKFSDATLSRWENGISDVSGAGLVALAKFFGVTTDYLLGLED